MTVKLNNQSLNTSILIRLKLLEQKRNCTFLNHVHVFIYLPQFRSFDLHSSLTI